MKPKVEWTWGGMERRAAWYARRAAAKSFARGFVWGAAVLAVARLVYQVWGTG